MIWQLSWDGNLPYGKNEKILFQAKQIKISHFAISENYDNYWAPKTSLHPQKSSEVGGYLILELILMMQIVPTPPTAPNVACFLPTRLEQAMNFFVGGATKGKISQHFFSLKIL